MHMLTRKDQWVTKTVNKTKKQRFQNQWVAKTIEKTKKTKKTKMSEPMGSQNHRENKKQQENQDFITNG